MRKVKKLIGVLLAAVMVLAMGVPAFRGFRLLYAYY